MSCPPPSGIASPRPIEFLTPQTPQESPPSAGPPAAVDINKRYQAFEVELNRALTTHLRLRTPLEEESAELEQEKKRYKAHIDYLFTAYDDVVDGAEADGMCTSYRDPSFIRDYPQFVKDFAQYEAGRRARQIELNEIIEEDLSFWTRQHQFHSASLAELDALAKKYNHPSTIYFQLIKSVDVESQNAQIALISIDLALLLSLPSLIYQELPVPEDRGEKIKRARQAIGRLLGPEDVYIIQGFVRDYDVCSERYLELIGILSITDLEAQRSTLLNFDFSPMRELLDACQYVLHRKRLQLILHPINRFHTDLAPLFQPPSKDPVSTVVEIEESDLLQDPAIPVFLGLSSTERRQSFEVAFDEALEKYATRMNLLALKSTIEIALHVKSASDAERQRYRVEMYQLLMTYGDSLEDETRNTLKESISSPVPVMQKRKLAQMDPQTREQKREEFTVALAAYRTWYEQESRTIEDSAESISPIITLRYNALSRLNDLFIEYAHLLPEESPLAEEIEDVQLVIRWTFLLTYIAYLTSLLGNIREVRNTIVRRVLIDETSLSTISSWLPSLRDVYAAYNETVPSVTVNYLIKLTSILSTLHLRGESPLKFAFVSSSLFYLEQDVSLYLQKLTEEADDIIREDPSLFYSAPGPKRTRAA